MTSRGERGSQMHRKTWTSHPGEGIIFASFSPSLPRLCSGRKTWEARRGKADPLSSLVHSPWVCEPRCVGENVLVSSVTCASRNLTLEPTDGTTLEVGDQITSPALPCPAL